MGIEKYLSFINGYFEWTMNFIVNVNDFIGMVNA